MDKVSIEVNSQKDGSGSTEEYQEIFKNGELYSVAFQLHGKQSNEYRCCE